jgi:predicted phage baseplate assembly protein
LTGGFYDAAPNLQTIVFNGALAEQAILPQKSRQQTVREEKPWIKLLRKGDGTPLQQVLLFDETDDGTNPSEHTVVESSVRIFTIEANDWKEWVLRPDFDSSTPADFDFLLDSREILITFGDGDKGRVVPKDVEIYATYLLTRAASGNVPARSITQIAAISHNQGISAEAYADIKGRLSEITNPLAAEGGVRPETVSDAAARAILARDQTPRAVTLEDYERLAKRTPGVRLARVFARANLHPSFPCFDALGVITVVVVPFLPRKKPSAGLNLCRTVADYLNRRRVIGTRVEVVGPTYVDVTVKAQVQAIRGADHSQLRQRLVLALNAFFDPLTGGPEHQGWPFGRDVYRAEVLQVLDEESGVEHVLLLELVDGLSKARCSNICLGPMDLVVAGNHQIEVM